MRSLILASLVVLAACDSADAVSVAGSNVTETLDCRGGSAAVAGSNDVLNLTGGCTALKVAGSNNRVIVEVAKGATISVTGSNNTVTWKSDGDVPPQVVQTGSDNTVQKGL
jgi:hypothetical protein